MKTFFFENCSCNREKALFPIFPRAGDYFEIQETNRVTIIYRKLYQFLFGEVKPTACMKTYFLCFYIVRKYILKSVSQKNWGFFEIREAYRVMIVFVNLYFCRSKDFLLYDTQGFVVYGFSLSWCLLQMGENYFHEKSILRMWTTKSENAVAARELP